MASFWEIGEFVSDQVFRANVQRGLGNTMRDLILGITGAAGLLLLFRASTFFGVLGDRRKDAYDRA